MVTIICDVHEKQSRIPELLEKLGAEVIIESLPTSDFILDKTTCVERKEYNDCYGSGIGDTDHNLFSQLDRCCKAFPAVILLIQQDKKLFQGNQQKYAVVEGMIKRAELRMGIIIKRADSVEKCADWLFKTAEWLQRHEYNDHIARVRPKPTKTKNELVVSREFWYEGLKNTGGKKAEELNTIFECPQYFMSWLYQLDFVYTKGGNYKTFKSLIEPLELPGYGEKWLKENKELLFTELTLKSENTIKNKENEKEVD